ncbi:hypothetical protein ETAA8_20940 [Anatilimnocola aggregata]|uniref:DUF1501 domain-containing protein n=1 Tax=Anatilimnocola aggregata TaxID=2528021 RepID=A0A517Y9U7_9BACT|nr:DUF1501 domain-containing protein [Anatilimnocola aggregata]QDU27010.1 hypothetical protein ETAA8_20940 [Anatilimnocola aggregata]
MNAHLKQITRRDILRVGSLGALGLSLIDLVRGRAVAEPALRPRAKNCILLWLDGGPSHLETFDLKPDAPAEVRGPFRAISTAVPGIQISELLPRTARITGKLALVRSLTSPLGEHGLANHYLLTGYQPSPVLQYPSYGSVLSHVRQVESILPPYIAVPESRSPAGAGYLSSAHEPFATGSDPSKPEFRVRDLERFPGVTEARLNRRREYLAEFERAQAAVEGTTASTDPTFEQAYRLVTSTAAKRAFDLSAETAEVRAGYGPRMFGQSCLLARRLVERGVPFVTVWNTGWDTHDGLTLQLRDGYSGAKTGVGLIPTFDLGFSALIEDLDQRGLLAETLVIAMGEFGRTPKLNTRGGRDHWPRVFSALLAGAGINGGKVIGASDRVGESPQDRPITPADLAATIYTLLGIDPQQTLPTADGRPVRVNTGGQLIHELI